MSSKYTTTNFPMKARKTSFINLMKVLGALVNTKGMTNHSYKPNLVLKVVFHSSPNFTQICWYPLRKFNFGKHNSTAQFIKHIIQTWNRVSISNGDIINSSTINTHTPWNSTRTKRLTYITFVE